MRNWSKKHNIWEKRFRDYRRLLHNPNSEWPWFSLQRYMVLSSTIRTRMHASRGILKHSNVFILFIFKYSQQGWFEALDGTSLIAAVTATGEKYTGGDPHMKYFSKYNNTSVCSNRNIIGMSEGGTRWKALQKKRKCVWVSAWARQAGTVKHICISHIHPRHGLTHLNCLADVHIFNFSIFRFRHLLKMQTPGLSE